MSRITFNRSPLLPFNSTILVVFTIMMVIDFFFNVSAIPDWFLPIFTAFQLVMMLLILGGTNTRLITNLNFLQLLGFCQIALIFTQNHFHNMVFWVSLIPMLVVATAIKLRDAIFWYLATLLYIIGNGFYFANLTPSYDFTVYPARFIVGGSLFLALTFFVSFMFYRMKENQQKVLSAKNDEIKNLNESLEQKIQERTAQLKNQNDKLRSYAFVTAHEVRAPLASILGLMSILDKKEFNDANHEIIDLLKESSNQLDKNITKQNRLLEEGEEVKS